MWVFVAGFLFLPSNHILFNYPHYTDEVQQPPKTLKGAKFAFEERATKERGRHSMDFFCRF